MGNVYGYVRVSSRDQNEERQLIAMRDFQIPASNIYTDKQSGKDFNRPMYQKLLRRAAPGDLICVQSIDRLGRNYDEILEQWKVLTKEKGIDLYVMDMPLLDTRRDKDLLGTLLSDVVLAVLSYVAENERRNIRQRQAEGIAAAKERGVRFGRPPKALLEDFEEIYELWRQKKITGLEAARRCGISEPTFRYRVRKRRK